MPGLATVFCAEQPHVPDQNGRSSPLSLYLAVPDRPGPRLQLGQNADSYTPPPPRRRFTALHRTSLWSATPPGVCSAPAAQYSGRPLPPQIRLCPRPGRPAQGPQHRPIGTTTFPPRTTRPGTVDSRNRQDVPPAGAPAARSRLYLYLVISPAVTFAAALDTRTAPHHPGRIINVLDTRYTILIKTRLPRASSQK